MKDKRIVKHATWRTVFAVGVALLITLKAGLVMGAEGIDPDAESILKSMSSYLGETKAFSVNVDFDFEVVTRNGQKLQLSSFATAVLKRPA